MPGSPARFTGIVKMSDRYIVSGSSVRSPSANAGVGATGMATTSTRSNAREKSRATSVRLSRPVSSGETGEPSVARVA